MDKDFEIEIEGLGFNTSGYPSAFTPKVTRIIEEVAYGKVLHLFSGVSQMFEPPFPEIGGCNYSCRKV